MSALKLIYSYLVDRTQTVKVKGERSTKRQIKSGVPQGSLPGVLLFNIYLSDMTLLMLTCLILRMIITSLLQVIQWMMDEAKELLINETETALNWIKANEMIEDPKKFHLMFLSPNKQDLIN